MTPCHMVHYDTFAFSLCTLVVFVVVLAVAMYLQTLSYTERVSPGFSCHKLRGGYSGMSFPPRMGGGVRGGVLRFF